MALVLFQMIFPPGLIPFYLTVRQLGLMDSYWAVILPYAINTFNMIVLMSYFRTLPPELEEAASSTAPTTCRCCGTSSCRSRPRS